jgi:hypothetical protein
MHFAVGFSGFSIETVELEQPCTSQNEVCERLYQDNTANEEVVF